MIYFDTETTGLIKNAALPLNLQPRIIEIGALKDNGEELSIILNRRKAGTNHHQDNRAY